MGFKLRGVIRCGRCGQPRGITHVCVTSRPRKSRTRLQAPVEWRCPACGRPRGVRHTCRPESDFKARRRKAETAARREKRRKKRQETRDRQKQRRKEAAAQRRARDSARKKAAKKKRSARSRPRGDSHEPGTCGNRDCPKYGCKAYWQGMADCPGPHDT